MDKIVVDSSVVIKWFVVEPLSREAHYVLDRYRSGLLSLLAPDLIYAEVGNVIWKKQNFQGLVAADAKQIVDEFRRLPFSVTSTNGLLDEAYRIAVSYKRTVYDAMYIALSMREQCPFVTADEKLVNAVRHDFPNIVWIANWP